MKILILRLSSLGDIVLTQPIAAWLRARYPYAEIDFAVKPQFSELVSLMDCELNPIPYEKSLRFHWALHRKRYDLVVDLHGKLSSYLITLAAAAPQTLHYNKARALRKRIVKGDSNISISSTLDLYRSALLQISEDVTLDSPRLRPALHAPLPDLPTAEKRILIFPGATHNTKQYPAHYYKELIVNSPKAYQYILLGSPSERSLVEQVMVENRTIDLCGRLNFAQLLTLIQSSDWVISSDSGPMHLAAAMHKAQIAIFGATHPRLGFAPLNPNAHIICADLDCQPCSLHGTEECPQGHFKCMHSISYHRILGIINQF
ncbi:MAG: glycosyltransferase family 9 protein [Candidatus Cloacimonetes bacterium]|nr:glycosyltransferase family 9 protein [Candidatus Cloacimonadota bacterium]